jgi:PhnB protein
MQVEPYLNFNGSCDKALDFYHQALGAKVEMLMRFKDSPDPAMCPAGTDGEKVMHACISIGDTKVMMSDGMGSGPTNFQGFSLSLTAPNDAEAERLFAALGDGGKVQMPMAKTFFASRFGMVADRFGLCWMVIVPSMPA